MSGEGVQQVSYRVVYEREAEADAKGRRWWLARIPAVKGCHTQGRTLDEARRRIREALGLFVEHAEHAELVDDVRLPKAITHVLKRVCAVSAEADRAQRVASTTTRKAVARLKRDLALSTRDTAEFLGLSHQRVSQLERDRAHDRNHKR